MNIPPKYEDVVAQLETERARVTDYIAQRAQTELKLEAALGREAALCKWQSEQSDKMDALREELGQCGSMAAMIEDKEWAEHAGSGPVSSRVESAFTQLHNELSEAQQRLTVAEKRAAVMEKALSRIAREHDCGCSPCTGSCTSQVALEITVDAMRDIAIAALKPAEGEVS